MTAMMRLLRCKIEGEQVDAIRGLGRGGEEGEEGGAGSSREEHMHILQFDLDCLALQRRRRHRAAPRRFLCYRRDLRATEHLRVARTFSKPSLFIAMAFVSPRRNMFESSTGSRNGKHEGDAVEVLVHELGRQEVPDMLLVSYFFETNTPSNGGELSSLGNEMPWYMCFEDRKLQP
jgi:hypothetical protein